MGRWPFGGGAIVAFLQLSVDSVQFAEKRVSLTEVDGSIVDQLLQEFVAQDRAFFLGHGRAECDRPESGVLLA